MHDDAQMVNLGTPNGPETGPNGLVWGPQESQNGPQMPPMVPRWPPMGPRRDPLGTILGPNIALSKEVTKNVTKFPIFRPNLW